MATYNLTLPALQNATYVVLDNTAPVVGVNNVYLIGQNDTVTITVVANPGYMIVDIFGDITTITTTFQMTGDITKTWTVNTVLSPILPTESLEEWKW